MTDDVPRTVHFHRRFCVLFYVIIICCSLWSEALIWGHIYTHSSDKAAGEPELRTVVVGVVFGEADDSVDPVLGVHEQLPPAELRSPLRRGQRARLLLAGLVGLHVSVEYKYITSYTQNNDSTARLSSTQKWQSAWTINTSLSMSGRRTVIT